ncbi:TIR domain-containing adapter molecule 1 isoform X2 [Thalassophryne amazonica]|uniref:TIR domain-containing adapter molecule 1 isoform X2 n=1 Tax=Thalassophryne amazonica TaxID=390379 RepID=UPI0014714DAC|nr:TIR domain-containing adapter molecule 1 isoform X2 [Thalassophryne amazonica]
MTHMGRENQGTGLREVFDILAKASHERLVSVSVKLGESPEDQIVHAFCLIFLQKGPQALKNLQSLRENCLANHLAEKWQMSGGKLEDFREHCAHVQDFTRECLKTLARIFNILSDQRLCDPLLRNLAYRRAVSCTNQKTSSCEDLEYDQLREEAKDLCGPQFEEWMCSSGELKLVSNRDSDGSLEAGRPTLSVSLSQVQTQNTSAHSLPSPLQASSSVSSYPTHIELSLPPTAIIGGDSQGSSNNPKTLLSFPQQSDYSPQPDSISHPLFESATSDWSHSNTPILKNETPKPSTVPAATPKPVTPDPTNTFPHKPAFQRDMHDCMSADEEEEDIFYPFVILHAPEDAEMAESMKEKLESVISCEGATFSEEFAIPGKSTLRCVEDAINNSAFTLLLLTRNFNTRMLEMKTDSALINSMSNQHKYNTVIPVLPRENCISKQSMPMVLKTLVPLDEKKNFEAKVRKALTPMKIKQQKNIWTAEQRVKIQLRKQEQQKLANKHSKQLIHEWKKAQLLEQEGLRYVMAQKLQMDPRSIPTFPNTLPDGGEGRTWWQPHSNIHIENAKYIMIGNDSQMTVGVGGVGDNGNDLIFKEEMQ